MKRAKKVQKEGEFEQIDESTSETESIDWDELQIEEEPSKAAAATEKGKSPGSVKAKTP